jgi:hypothetical protein
VGSVPLEDTSWRAMIASLARKRIVHAQAPLPWAVGHQHGGGGAHAHAILIASESWRACEPPYCWRTATPRNGGEQGSQCLTREEAPAGCACARTCSQYQQERSQTTLSPSCRAVADTSSSLIRVARPHQCPRPRRVFHPAVCGTPKNRARSQCPPVYVPQEAATTTTRQVSRHLRRGR